MNGAEAMDHESLVAGRVRDDLAKPHEAEPRDDGVAYPEDEFDPWSLFPCLYGSYSSCFDKLAVDVLTDLKNSTYRREDLASEIFREMLCTANLCDYGTSPRVCFPTESFKALLPELIGRWTEYGNAHWGCPDWLDDD